MKPPRIERIDRTHVTVTGYLFEQRILKEYEGGERLAVSHRVVFCREPGQHLLQVLRTRREAS
jgi:hypothetical protein